MAATASMRDTTDRAAVPPAMASSDHRRRSYLLRLRRRRFLPCTGPVPWSLYFPGAGVIEQALCPVLVGREDELAALEDVLLAASRGQGRIALLAGEAGLGKTRLATELMRRATRIGFRWLWGGCSESDLALPYIPFLEAIGNYLAVSDVNAIKQRLGAGAAELGKLFPQLADPAAPPTGADDPAQAKLRLYEAFLTFFTAMADDAGSLIVIEDLHWADASTRELLDYLARRIRGSKIMILGTYRRDEMHRKHPLAPVLQAWRRTGLAEIVDIHPLSPASVERMIAAIFDREVTPDFRDLLFQRSEGNPFVLEEMLKEAIDRGDLYRTASGRWERKEIADISIPQTVADSILLRVERLDDEYADVLRAGAVLGRSFAFATLVAITGAGEDVVLGALRECVRQQLLEEEEQAPGRYRFRHALTRESVYEDMIEPERRRLHARAADVLAQDPNVPAGELAGHLLAAGRHEEAVPMCLRAGEEAEARFGFREAIALYERALPYIREPEQRGLTLCRVGQVWWMLGETERGRAYLEEGIPLLESTGRDVDAARYRIWLGRCFWEMRDPVHAREQYETACSALTPRGPSDDLAHVLIRLAGLHAFDLETSECERLATEARRIAEEIGSRSTRVFADLFLALAKVLHGRMDEGAAEMDDALNEAIALDIGWLRANVVANACIWRFGSLRAGEIPALIEHGLEPMYDSIQRDSGIAFFQGVTDFILGDIAGALDLLEGGESSLRLAWQLFYQWSRGWVAEMRAEQRRFDDALATLIDPGESVHHEELLWFTTRSLRVLMAAGQADRALEGARIVAMRPQPITAFRELVPEVVRTLCAAGAVDEAETYFAAVAGEAGSQQAYIDRARGILALARGDAAGAIEASTHAVDAFEAAGYAIDEMYVRHELASAHAAVGDAKAARDELCRELAISRRTGSLLHELQARDTADELGVVLDEPDDASAPAPLTDESREATERLVTVMFADVRGYTAMTRAEAPADMLERMTTFYRWARREIERTGGMVDRYAGDAVMASWNTSISELEHTLRALQAARAMQDRARLMDLPLGIGIAVGSALVGRLTGGDNVDVIGETTNLAARLQAQATAGQIVLSDEANRRVRSWMESNGVDVNPKMFELKGLGSVEAFVIGVA